MSYGLAKIITAARSPTPVLPERPLAYRTGTLSSAGALTLDQV